MKKIIFGVFAHPDDEAFGGPSGALLSETKSGTELHLVTLTAGDAGTNPDNLENLGETRLEEWRSAGELLGARTMTFLGYKDGALNNLDMIEIAHKLVDIVEETIVYEPEDTTIEFMSLDLGGLTGHIDHIVAARAACLAFYRLKRKDSRIKRIRLACLSRATAPVSNTEWLYMDAGHAPDEISETVDARRFADEITAIARAHYTQRDDGENFLASSGDSLGMCYFIVKN